MDRRDYYVEYYEVLDRVLSDYVNHLRAEKEYWLKMGRHDVGVPLINLLFWQFTWHREEYDRLRKEGKSCGEALGSVKEILADKQVEEWERQEEEYKIYDHEWYEALAPYGGQLVIYIYNARQLAYLTPLIERLEEPVLLLSEYEIPDETELPDFVTAITLEFTKTAPLVNPFLKEWFPLIFQYANTFDILMRILQPKGLIFLEGCHYQQLLLATIGRDYGMPTLCIQQGWPSLMHTAFRRMPYRYYLMWGEDFRTLWEKHNPLPDFVPTGYMYQVEPRNETKKECVTFFLQGPFFLSDKKYLAFLDSDDWLAENALYVLCGIAAKTRADIVSGNTLAVHPDGRVQSWERRCREVFAKGSVVEGETYFYKVMDNRCYVPMVYNYLYRREFLMEYGFCFEPGLIHEDELWTPQVLTAARKIAIADIDFYYYRQREGSIMAATAAQRRIASIVIIIDKLLEYTQKCLSEKKHVAVREAVYERILQIYATACALHPYGTYTTLYDHAGRMLRICSELRRKEAVGRWHEEEILGRMRLYCDQIQMMGV